MNNHPDITVSIVSYNTRELLRQCLQSLRARRDEGEATLQILVPDNGSTDGTLEMVAREFPEVEAFATGGNLGYGRANNMAFEKARGRYFFALNSDTEVEPGALATLRDFLDAHPQAGGAGAQLIWPDGQPQASFGLDPQLCGILLEQAYLDKLTARLHRSTPAPAAAENEVPEYSDATPREVEQICGACQFVRAEAYRQVEGYDPAYFMYHEDVDLNMRLRAAGWKLYFVPAARIRHHLGASSERDWQTRARMVSALNWSRYHYYHRHEGPWRGRLLKAAFIFGAGLRLGGWTAIALARPTALDKVKLFRRVFRNACAMRPDTQI